jgi:hypothetical protein
MMHKVILSSPVIAIVAIWPLAVSAQDDSRANPFCPVDHDRLAEVLKKSVKPSGGPSNGGLDNNEWAAVVNHWAVSLCSAEGWRCTTATTLREDLG